MRCSAPLLSVLCLGSLELACGVSLRSSDSTVLQQQFQSSTFLSMQQQFQLISAGAAAAHQRELAVSAKKQLDLISAGAAADHQRALAAVAAAAAATKQAQKVNKAPRPAQKVSLLTIMKNFKGKQAEARQVKSMPSNMAELKQRLSSLQNAEHQLEKQVASQQQAFELSQEADFNGKDDQLAVKVWCKRKVIGCSAFSIAIAIWIISAMSGNKKGKPTKLEAIDTSSLNETAAATAKEEEPEPSEMSKALADLADLIGKVKMVSESSSEMAQEAMNANKMVSENASKVAQDLSIINEPATHE